MNWRYLRIGYTFVITLCVAIGSVLLGADTAVAQASRTDLTLYPSKTTLSLSPGEVWQGELRVAVNSDTATAVELNTADFRSDSGEGGIPYFYQAEEKQEQGMLSRWIELTVTRLDLPPSTFGTVPVTIRVPANATPGGHYGAVLVRPERDDPQLESSNAAIDQYLAGLFIVNVAGRTVEQGGVTEFYFTEDVYSQLPAEGVVRFKNDGNTHVSPTGTIEIFNELGVLVSALPVNADAGLVLPTSTRRFSAAWGERWVQTAWSALDVGKPWAFGLYRAKLTLWYGSLGKVVERETTFVVLPWLPLGALLLLTWIGSFGLRWAKRRYQLWVLARRPLRFDEDGVPPTPTAPPPPAGNLG